MPFHQVLLVDGQAEVRRALRAALDSLGPELKVLEVPSGEEALLVSGRQPVDLMVIDAHLAGMSGLELLRKVKPRRPKLKVILITSSMDPSVRQQIAGAGADAFFFKPVETAGFLSAVERCLDRPPAHPGLSEAPEKGIEAGLLTSENLSDLRHKLQAALLLLTDECGQVIGRSGVLQAPGEEAALISASIAALHASRAVSRSLGVDTPENLLVLSSAEMNVTLSHAGGSQAFLIAVGPPSADKLREEIPGFLAAATAGLPELPDPAGPETEKTDEDPTPPAESGAASQSEAVAPEDVPKDALEMEDVFHLAAKTSWDAKEVDAFWNDLVDENGDGSIWNAEVLSYDEAYRLGLAPGGDGTGDTETQG